MMLNNYLILDFQNAKLFRKFDKKNVNRKCGDFVFDGIKSYKSRDFYPAFIEPITVHQISNMLHVLFNERPVPSLRNVLYQRNDYYFEKALESYLKIDNLKNHNDDYYFETNHVKKAVWNSWNPSVPTNWEIVRRYIDDVEKLRVFVNKLNEVLDEKTESLAFSAIRNKVIQLPKPKRLDLYNTIKELKSIDGIIYYFGRYVNQKFDKPDNAKLTTKRNKTAKMVNTGLESAVLLSGKILVPVNNQDIEILRNNSKGFATILDDGLVFIDSIKHENHISVQGFIKVETISDEKTKPFKTI